MKAQQVFKKNEALKYIHGKGFALGKTAFYGHCKDGKCLVQKDKTILLVDLLDYIETHLDAGRTEVESDSALSRRDKELDIAIKEEKKKKYEIENRKNDSGWIERSAHEEQLAGLVTLMRDNFRHHASKQSQTLIEACAGDMARQGEAIGVIQRLFNDALNDVANGKSFEILVGEHVADQDEEEL